MSTIERDDRMTFTGEVISSNKGIFQVKINDDHFVTCRIGGRLKMHEIKIIVGDQVSIEVSPYNLVLGRIVKRLKAGAQ